MPIRVRRLIREHHSRKKTHNLSVISTNSSKRTNPIKDPKEAPISTLTSL